MAASRSVGTIYDILDRDRALFDALDIALQPPDGDESDEDRELREQKVAELEQMLVVTDQQFLAKVDGYVAVLRELGHLKARRKLEKDRLARRQKTAEAAEERLKAYLLAAMQFAGRDHIETGRFTVRIQINPPTVNVADEAAIPPEFNRTKIIVEPDKIAIREHWKATGEVVPGVSIDRGQSLRLS